MVSKWWPGIGKELREERFRSSVFNGTRMWWGQGPVEAAIALRGQVCHNFVYYVGEFEMCKSDDLGIVSLQIFKNPVVYREECGEHNVGRNWEELGWRQGTTWGHFWVTGRRHECVCSVRQKQELRSREGNVEKIFRRKTLRHFVTDGYVEDEGVGKI